MWIKEVELWSRAEEEAIVQEEIMGVRRQPLSPMWREVTQALSEAAEGRDHTAIVQEGQMESDNQENE